MKPWSTKLRQHVARWAQEAIPAKGLARYVYRFDEIGNTVKILNSGELLSRAECDRRGVEYADCASSAVISKTEPAHKDFVRLYFLPRTPTQFHMEGIRPPTKFWQPNVHCPVPVFLLFDFVSLLGEDSTQFSIGNMATPNVEFGDSEALFDKIPFDLVYHRGTTWGHPQATSIKFHRHAEVLVPVRLPIDGVVRIVCRSHPERRTLLHFLKPEVRSHFENMTHVYATHFFERSWAFVEKVEPNRGSLKFTFHPANDSENRASEVQFQFETGKNRWTWKEDWKLNAPLNLNLRKALPTGVATLKIDGCLAFKDNVTLDETPI